MAYGTPTLSELKGYASLAQGGDCFAHFGPQVLCLPGAVLPFKVL